MEHTKKESKINDFLSEYGELVKKHGIDFASYPVFVPDENGAFKIICQTTPIDLSEIKKANNKDGFIV